jgi:hypothetical protein
MLSAKHLGDYDSSCFPYIMRVRRFFLTSLVFAILAIVLEMACMSQYSRAGHVLARGFLLPESERTTARVKAETYRRRGTIIGIAGLGFALTSLGLAALSARKHEPAWHSITIALLIFYGMLQFALP